MRCGKTNLKDLPTNGGEQDLFDLNICYWVITVTSMTFINSEDMLSVLVCVWQARGGDHLRAGKVTLGASRFVPIEISQRRAGVDGVGWSLVLERWNSSLETSSYFLCWFLPALREDSWLVAGGWLSFLKDRSTGTLPHGKPAGQLLGQYVTIYQPNSENEDIKY